MISLIKDTLALLIALVLMPPALVILGAWVLMDWIHLKLETWSKS